MNSLPTRITIFASVLLTFALFDVITSAQQALSKPAFTAAQAVRQGGECKFCNSLCQNKMCCNDGFGKCGVSGGQCVCFADAFADAGGIATRIRVPPPRP
ncbi:unnamed protein product [Orchesella dallaii]|uniref:Uncharacterized protein n=1 Tax=Orchesella dallaii TaxID=48710 RepID=A0ABP1RVE1_9HEXA